MGPPILIGLLSASGWVLFVTFRRLMARRAGMGWWLAFAGLVVCGSVVGYRGCFLEYRVSPELRVVGVPLPMCAFHLEKGNWVDYVHPLWFGHLIAFTNTAAVTALVVLPLSLALRRRTRIPD